MIRLASFKPRMAQTLQGYSRGRLVADALAGCTVAVVALPLAMAFAIASGLKPEAGLWATIVGGALVSLLGGSNVQIAGPSGAFIVVLYAIAQQYGLPHLLVATSGAGVLLFLMGLFRLGQWVRFVPVSVVLGYTNGLAVLIAVSQLRDGLGLPIDRMPADVFNALRMVFVHVSQTNWHALALASVCVLGLAVWPKLWAANWTTHAWVDLLRMRRLLSLVSQLPAPVVALVSLSALAYGLDWAVPTIGTRFGGIPQTLPSWQWPDVTWTSLKQLVPPTMTIAMLAAIEALLCARVADEINTQLPPHDPNQELMAQGVANFVSPFLGGMALTGTISRTVTNLRAGATTPIAGLVHAVCLLAIVWVLAPLAVHVPLSVLAGILWFVAWQIGDWQAFARLTSFSNHYRLMVMSAFLVTLIFDLTLAVELGLVLACVLFVRRQSQLFEVLGPVLQPDMAPPTWRICLKGNLFFGAMNKLDHVAYELTQLPSGGCVVLDMSELWSLDTTGVHALEQWLELVQKRQGSLRVAHAKPQPLSLMQRSGFWQKLSTDGDA